MNILVLNSGSSSLRYKLFAMEKEETLAYGRVERIGVPTGTAKITHNKQGAAKYSKDMEILNHEAALKIVLNLLTDPEHGVLSSLEAINAVGHRVLHGAEYYKESVVVDEQVFAKMEELKELGPLHMPANMMGIQACWKLMPGVIQVAVFDTAFHQTMPKKAYLYALPFDLYRKHRIRRYGFHGTSHRYVAECAAKFLGRPAEELKLITMHLGNGCSMAAIDGGKVIDTSMGFTPLEGLVMGTRSGNIDPAVLPVLCRFKEMTVEEAVDYLNKKSGLLGMCGYSDMRDVYKAIAKGAEDARIAYEVFIYQIIKFTGAYYAALKGLDALVFTAGIGENELRLREDVCKELEFMGVKLDYALNRTKPEQTIFTPTDLSASDSKIKVLVIPTDEELVIARDTYRLATLSRA
ncbi:MAG: acetate kinase [Firmicutes bacterium]|nr:acetate kinase [Bacillota bacterium]